MNLDHQTQLRRKWIAYWREVQEARDAGYSNHLPFPQELHDLRCGAKTRAGTPCKMNALHRNGRCKLHGGMSTGPRSAAGKARSAQNGRPHHKPEPHEDLIKPNVEPVPSGEEPIHLHGPVFNATVASQATARVTDDVAASTMVRCVDCLHMSAAHTCMLNAAKGKPIGAKRLCLLFVPALAWG